jgi:hypothetical protein
MKPISLKKLYELADRYMTKIYLEEKEKNTVNLDYLHAVQKLMLGFMHFVGENTLKNGKESL